MAWYTEVKIIAIVYVHGHKTVTVVYWWMVAFGKQKQFCFLGFDTNDKRLCSRVFLHLMGK